MTVAIIQARLGSHRYPQKMLAPLDGRPLIAHVVDRVREVKGLDHIVLACPPSDYAAFSALNPPCEIMAPDVPEDDVLARYHAVASCLHLDDHCWIMRVTGDCPVWRPWVGTGLIALRDSWLATLPAHMPTWFTADTHVSGFPDGCDAELFPAWLVREAHHQATWPADREHVTRWMRRHHPPAILSAPHDEGHLKLSVDTSEDLTVVQQYLRAVTSSLNGVVTT